ncbi:MAG: hypothetical protein KC457_21440, partial [Myxococcales bacterium]|nr:hypothetical protein [Myxococcales bacterium]
MSQKRVIDFNALPKPTRERFVASCKGEGKPRFLHEDTSSPTASAIGGIIVLVLGLGMLYSVANAAFGYKVDEPGYLVLYGFAGFCLMGGLLATVRALLTGKALPYKNGTYLFPLDLVTTDGKELTLQPLAGLSHVNGVHQYQNGTYMHTDLTLAFKDGTVTVLKIHGPVQAEQVLQGMRTSQVQAAEAVDAGNYGIFADLDPFYEARTGGQWEEICGQVNAKTPTDSPRAGSTPGILKRAWGLGLILGLVLGGGVWQLRNIASDDAMFERVKDSTDKWELEDYLWSGGTRHEAEVRDVLIPRAEFEEAKAQGSVTALREFIETHPGSVHEPDARVAIHELFTKALRDFEEQAKGGNNEQVFPLMQSLFAWLEANDSPPLEVRFRPPDPSLLEDVDKLVTTLPKDETGGLPLAPISPSFTDERSLARESWIATELENGFRRVIPADILDLDMGERLPADLDLSENRPARPTIAVTYSVDASGSIYANETNTQGYVGIQVYFIVSMLVPGLEGGEAPQPLTFILDVQPPSEFSVETGGIAIEPSDYLVYDVMAKKAFENLAGSLGSALFATGEAGSLQIISGEIPELPTLDLREGEDG